MHFYVKAEALSDNPRPYEIHTSVPRLLWAYHKATDAADDSAYALRHTLELFMWGRSSSFSDMH